MLRSLKSLKGYKLLAQDGEIGSCWDFLFEDMTWVVRYLVANTGSWLVDRRVLISPISLGDPDWDKLDIPVRLTKEQIEKSPKLDSDAPVSRKFEKEWFSYFDWPYYWGGNSFWGAYPYPGAMLGERKNIADEARELKKIEEENCLRSVDEIAGHYYTRASDGDIGHIDDFIIEDATWVIRYIVVDTSNWLLGKKVLISPQWVKDISWSGHELEVNLMVEEVKNSPEFDPENPVNRKYEIHLYDYYGRPKYWEKNGN